MNAEAPKKAPTRDEMVRFFDATGADQACPSCGNENWSLSHAPDGYIAQLSAPGLDIITHVPPEGLSRYIFPVVFVVCSRCFFIRMHSALAIRYWCDNNPPPEGRDA